MRGGIAFVSQIEEDGQVLYPAIVQDALSHQVMMLAYVNDEALALTRETGWAHFYSRSRRQLWRKGESSGRSIRVRQVLPDCDNDTFLYVSEIEAPVCHRDTWGCFAEGEAWTPDPLALLDSIVRARLQGEPDPESYTQRLFGDDMGRIAQKVGEEAVEVAIESVKMGQDRQNAAALTGEVVDLLYHLSILLVRSGITLQNVSDELMRRHQGRGSVEESRTNPA